MVRPAGLLGRLPARAPADRFPLGWVSAYLAQPLPPPVYPVDVTHGVTRWGMLGNGPDPYCTTHPDGVGDCTYAARQHVKYAKALAGGEHRPGETSNELVAEYLMYDHGQDNGAVIADLLLHWYHLGIVLAFAPVHHTDPAAVDAAVQAFHGAYVGVNLTDDADRLFGQHEPWTVSGGQRPDPNLGHCVVKMKSTRDSWTNVALAEAWVIITEEDTANHNLDITALRRDIDALHGMQ